MKTVNKVDFKNLTSTQTEKLTKIDNVFTRLFDGDVIKFSGDVNYITDEITNAKGTQEIEYFALDCTVNGKPFENGVAISTFRKMDYLNQPINKEFAILPTQEIAKMLKGKELTVQIVPTTVTKFTDNKPDGTKVSGLIHFVGMGQNAIAL